METQKEGGPFYGCVCRFLRNSTFRHFTDIFFFQKHLKRQRKGVFSFLSNHFFRGNHATQNFRNKMRSPYFHSHIFFMDLAYFKKRSHNKSFISLFPFPFKRTYVRSSRYSCRIKGFSQIYCIVKEYARCDTLGINGVS